MKRLIEIGGSQRYVVSVWPGVVPLWCRIDAYEVIDGYGVDRVCRVKRREILEDIVSLIDNEKR